ncbi:universal stress protein [Microbacterium sp. P07]|uniref:universal stress protein n=1 Tax=Microbacterium sp. P07 TaxID=3366952 RepID=UPI0037452C0E
MNAQLVVGWDGSASAQRALGWAQQQRGATSLLLVQVVKEGTLVDSFDPWGVPLSERDSSLEAAAAGVRESAPHLVVETRTVEGGAAEELARFTRPDVLLIVGDRHRSALRFRAGWSVGARLAAVAAGPVAIIGDDLPLTASGVVVGVDDSDGARAALIFAAQQAELAGDSLHVVHAWHSSSLWRDRAMPPARSLTEIDAQHAEILTEAVDEARRLHPALEVVGTVADASAGRALLDASIGRSLVVAGDGNHTRIERMLLGSASHELLLNLTVPTVIVGRHVAGPREVSSAREAEDEVALTRPSTQIPARTVVGWDGSRPSRSALEWAVAREQAGPMPGHVDIVMVADEPLSDSDSEVTASTMAFDERAVQHLINQVGDSSPGVALRGKVVYGFALHALSELTRADTLLVIGTEDREGSRLRFGFSVGAHLPLLAHGPIAIVPATVDPSLTGVAVGVDGSASSDSAVLIAAAEADRRHETLRLVHTWVKPMLYYTPFSMNDDYVADVETDHHSILDAAQLLATATYPNLTIETHLVLGNAAQALAELTPAAAVIVIGNRGLSGWQRLRVGSISHQLVMNLRVPLIIAGHPGAARRVTEQRSPGAAKVSTKEALV